MYNDSETEFQAHIIGCGTRYVCVCHSDVNHHDHMIVKWQLYLGLSINYVMPEGGGGQVKC